MTISAKLIQLLSLNQATSAHISAFAGCGHACAIGLVSFVP
jgi:hypothetical protein